MDRQGMAGQPHAGRAGELAAAARERKGARVQGAVTRRRMGRCPHRVSARGDIFRDTRLRTSSAAILVDVRFPTTHLRILAFNRSETGEGSRQPYSLFKVTVGGVA